VRKEERAGGVDLLLLGRGQPHVGRTTAGAAKWHWVRWRGA
jgi:hypothetical protein